MREISTEDMKVGEHIIVDGVEYVAEECDKDCKGCDLYHCGHCHVVPCTVGIILKFVEKHSIEEQDKDTPMTLLQLAEWLSKGNGVWKYSKDSHYEAINIEILDDYDYESKSVDNEYLIRPWGTDEWIKPTVGIYRRDCR